MAADQKTGKEEQPTSVRRGATGALVAIQLVLALMLFLSANYLSGTHHKAWDLSRNNQFTLSNQTRKLLKSSLLKDRNNPVRLIAVVRKSSTHHVRLLAMLEEYQRLAGGKLTVEFVDPIRDADAALEIADQYETTFVEDVVIINAIPPLPPAPENGAEAAEHAEKIKALRKSHIQYVPVEDMLVFGIDARRDRRLFGYQDEDQLTSGIRRAIEGKPRRFYFLADKSQVAGAEEDAPWDFLNRTFASLNIELVPIRISGLDKIPEDAAGIALVAPRYDMDERELVVFREYWGRPRAAVLVVLDPTLKQQPPQLRAFLREHGVTPRANRLFTMRGSRQIYDVAATFTNVAAVGDLGNASTLFEGASCSLEIRENAEDLDLRRIEPYPLITALARYSAQPLDGSPPIAGPHYLGASVSRGNERSDATAGQTSRMIVVSNSNFLRPRERHKEHIDFIRNTTNWLIGREELIGIGPKPVQHYKLNLLPAQVSFANTLNLFIIPGLFFLVAVVVWNARRA
ncbi:MAG: Gldg family protein [Roseibacillus sp.]